MHELRQVVNVDLMLAEQRMLEGDIHAAVGILNVEDDGIAANFAPVADDAKSMVAGSHDAGEINRPDFEVFGDRNGLFYDGCSENSRDRNLLARLQYVAGAVAIYRRESRRPVPTM